MLLTKMKYAVAVLVIACSHSAHADTAYTFGSGVNQFNMTFVPIGSPSNAADTTGSPNPAGAVSNDYQIGKYEVSEDMITKFNASQSLQITKDTRGTNKPATSVSWNEAARFTNWLNTSTGGVAAYKFTTSGVNDSIALWTPSDTLDYNAANPFRSLRANYVLPNIDEWYKATYYDPGSGVYFDHATGSNTAPTAVTGGTSPGTAVYSQTLAQGPADVDNAGGLSPFGVMGLAGNVQELNETETDLINDFPIANRVRRGGAWNYPASTLSSVSRLFVSASSSGSQVGFRLASLEVAAVPEPTSLLGAVSLGAGGLMYRRRRRAKNS